MLMPLTAVLALAAGCASTGRIEHGVFYSAKGYRVTLPRTGWTVQPGGGADLELRRADPPGGMLADATCGGRETQRNPGLLARHLTFGLAKRETLQNGTRAIAGRPAAHTVVRGSVDGAPVAVEAVVIKGERCVYDFLYVAPAAHFETGRDDFRKLVESFAGGEP
jgi:hypothetical protein